ncbi:MAG: hypothetical protein U5J63_12650 [Fodinibius sp.]|nr:hypothetical protein [Fodinibius sp.]
MNNPISKDNRSLYIALSATIMVAVALLVLPDISMGQLPPGLPDDPEQTPIDGGLGILAALGGTYAIKKLREKE